MESVKPEYHKNHKKEDPRQESYLDLILIHT